MYQNYVNINFDRNKVLGHGTYGSVFKGDYEGKEVAVKRTPLVHVTSYLITDDEYLKSIRHPNLVMLLHISRDEDFRFAVMELCAASVECLFLEDDDPKKYNGPSLPSNQQVLLQLSNGLGYLHSLKIMHGDIKPENILISSTSPVQMKWTGFGFGHSKKESSSSLSQSATRMGSRRWWAPEMYKDENEITEKGEVFSTGCVFLYFLSGGRHPFATSDLGEFSIAVNVIEGKVINSINLSEDKLDFVWKMIKTDPEERIPLHEVIENLEILQRPNSIIQFQSLQYDEKSYLNGQYLCGLCVLKSEGMVVKRIPTNHCSTYSYMELKRCNISNIVRLFHFAEQESFKYFGMEFCAASLDQFFLPDEDPKKYKGPMPSHEQVFFQIVTGLQYIHDNNLVHGSIKPSNILISSSQDPQIKLAEFGLTLPRWNNIPSLRLSDLGFQSDQYWIAPELLCAFNTAGRKNFTSVFKPTTKSDVYAAGKVFFYYYAQFYANIIPNCFQPSVSTGNEENMFKKLPVMGYSKIHSEHFPIHMISKMSEKEPESRMKLASVIYRIKSFPLTSKGELKKPKDPTPENTAKLKIKFSRDHILGKGGQAVVHLGLWEGSIAAIKRISTRSHKVTKELQLQDLDHRNIVRFFGSEKDTDFIYIAIEKCLVSLYAYCRQPQLYQGVIPMPSDQQVLLQMAEGLQYIHSKNLIHRDVKPANILISVDNPAVIKWSDFGLSKNVINQDEAKSKEAENWFSQGTEGWMAPEIIIRSEIFKDDDKMFKEDDLLKATKKTDVFCLGCVFYFFLFSAAHPFGNNNFDRKTNITTGNPTHFKNHYKRKLQFSKIIEGMIEFDSSLRTEIAIVIEQLNQYDVDSELSDLVDGLNLQLSLGSRSSDPDLEPNIKKRKK